MLRERDQPGAVLRPPPDVAPVPLSVAPELPSAPRLGWRALLLLYGGFAAGVFVVTWPLILAPATLWPPHHDARVFTWEMASIGRRLVSAPSMLFHGNAFYPDGETLAYTELLLPPALLGFPGFLWGNPILTYNLLLLVLWPLNGLAMAWVAHSLTGSRPAAWLAGAVFCLSPYFSEYYLEFQMLLAALLPVAVLAWVRWLETRERRWLGLTFAALTAQALTSWYYAIILGLGLATVGLGVLCLRYRAWAWWRYPVPLAVASAGTLAVLLPFAMPYLRIRQEFDYERVLGEAASHSADVFTFFEAGDRGLLYRVLGFHPSGSIAESSAFVGVTVLALAAVALARLRDDIPRPPRWLSRAGLVALLGSLIVLGWAVAFPRAGRSLGPLLLRPRASEWCSLALGLGIVLLVLRGWTLTRAEGPRALSRGDWVRLLLFLTAAFAILALGPVIHVGRQAIGPGPYRDLYNVLFPLHALRVPFRFAVISVAGLALLAALGLSRLEERLGGRPAARRALLAGIFVAVGVEYAVGPAIYEAVAWAPRPVDTVLRADPRDVAVLEWPTNVADADADAMLRSLWHGKRLVNGLSGVVPGELRELSDLLSRPAEPFPAPEAVAALRRIHPLRYLVVRLADPGLPEKSRAVWRDLRSRPPSLLRFRGSFGAEDLYELAPLPERGVVAEREMSYEYLHTYPRLRVAVRPLVASPDLEQWVDVALNGRPMGRVPASGDDATVALTPPFRQAEPNTVSLRYRYRPLHRPPPLYGIGATGAVSPADLRVLSAGQPVGNTASIQVNGMEWAPGRRGYNLVALEPSGAVRAAAVFDTFFEADAAARLAAWITALPAGTVVAGAAKDEASGRLTEPAVRALGALGVAGDLRGRFRESHAFVGVKGALPGTALEGLGSQPIDLIVGPARTDLGFELRDFSLYPAP